MAGAVWLSDQGVWGWRHTLLTLPHPRKASCSYSYSSNEGTIWKSVFFVLPGIDSLRAKVLRFSGGGGGGDGGGGLAKARTFELL